MRFCNSITAKVLVWLAGVLVPLESLPLTACNCADASVRATKLETAPVVGSPVAACPHCKAESRARHSCCGSAAALSASHGSCCCCCCGTGSTCCCCSKGAGHSNGGTCRCAKNGCVPPTAPLSSNSRTDNTKSRLAVSSGTVATVVVPSRVFAQTAGQPSLPGCTSLERLSTLCRLVL